MTKKALLIKAMALALSLLMLSSCGDVAQKTDGKKDNANTDSGSDMVSSEEEQNNSRPWQTYTPTGNSGFEFGNYDGSSDESSSSSSGSASSNSNSNSSSNSAGAADNTVEKPVIPYNKQDLLKLMSYLTYQTDNYALGIHGYGALDVGNLLEKFKEKTGKYPAYFDFDMNDLPFNTSERNLNRAVAQLAEFASKGGFVCITDHWVSPLHNYSEKTNGGANNSRDLLTKKQFDDVMIAGTEMNKNFMEELEFKVNFLKKLKEYNVPVIYRPVHEGGDNFFWWGINPQAGINGEDVAKLYRYVHDYFAVTHGLDNILWEMCDALASGISYEWYPGDEYVDIISNDWYMDIHENTSGSSYHYGQHYNESKQYGNGNMPYAISELGGDGTYDAESLPLKQTLGAVEKQIAKGYKTGYIGLYFGYGKNQDCSLPDSAITLDLIAPYWQNALK